MTRGSRDATGDLRLPSGETRESLLEYLRAHAAAGADERVREELRTYLESDILRFLRTLALVPEGGGRLLEVGADPYYLTHLLRRFRRYELSLTNGHGDRPTGNEVRIDGPQGRITLRYDRFDLERDDPPAAEGSFDVALCCEVIEHLTMDPLRGLITLNRCLKPGGTLVLTTPNAARLDVVVRALAGRESVHDQYSAYGPCGRHNREYAPGEMRSLLEHAGFAVEVFYTADVHPRPRTWRRGVEAAARWGIRALRSSLGAAGRGEAGGLGFYTFFRVTKIGPPRPGRPSWLYRSYGPEPEPVRFP